MLLHVLLVTTRWGMLRPFIEGLRSDPDVCLEQASSGVEAMGVVRTQCPRLVVIDSCAPEDDPLDLVKKTVAANAMVNTAVISSLDDAEFHEKSEGLGVLCRLPAQPDGRDAQDLLRKLRGVL